MFLHITLVLQTLNVFTLMFGTWHTKSELYGFQTNIFFIWKKGKALLIIINSYAVLVGLQDLVKNVIFIYQFN